MFFQDPNKLPDELILEIVQRLPLKDAIALLSTDRQMRAFIDRHGPEGNIWKKYGATNFEGFITNLQNLPEVFRPLILHERCTFAVAIEASQAFSQPKENRDLARMVRAAISLAPELKRLFPDMKTFSGDDSQLIALIERNLPPNMESEHLQCFLFQNTLIALADRLLTLDQVLNLPTQNLFQFATNENALKALRRNQVTIDQLGGGEDVNELINRRTRTQESSPSSSPSKT